MPPRDPTSSRRSKRSHRAILLGIGGITALAAAGIGIGYPFLWSSRSNTAGERLLHEEASQPVARPAFDSCASLSSDVAAAGSTSGGVLEIPSLSTTAPVLEGLSDAVLSKAAGHDPKSVWPGDPGEAIIEAHDVSYFAGIDKIEKGARIVWRTPCFEATFVVTRTEIARPGDVINPPAGTSGLALVTCYPTDALFFTSQRFVVESRLLSEQDRKEQLPGTSGELPELSVPAPRSLLAEGLTLKTNELALGSMHLDGDPSATFTKGPAPLHTEALALEVLFGAEKAVEAQNASWWRAIALPGLAEPTSWPSFSTTDVTIDVAGSKVASVTFSSGPASAVVKVENGSLHLAGLS